MHYFSVRYLLLSVVHVTLSVCYASHSVQFTGAAIDSKRLLNWPLQPDIADGNMLAPIFTFSKAQSHVNRPT